MCARMSKKTNDTELMKLNKKPCHSIHMTHENGTVYVEGTKYTWTLYVTCHQNTLIVTKYMHPV